MPFVVRAFPLVAPLPEFQEFVASIQGERREDMARFYRHYGVTYESWHLQETPAGPWVLCVTQIENPTEAAERYARASEEFDAWFKQQVLRLTGIDPSIEPLGPPTTELFAWQEGSRR